MVTTHEMQIEGHKLVALSFNPNTHGTPIVLLHGITSSVHLWTPDQTSLFVERGPCYALSLPGHYPAAFPDHFQQEALTAKMMARVLTTAIRQLVGNQPVGLVGHSTGGFAVLDIAAHSPKVPRCILSVSGFAQGQWTGALGFNQWLARRGFPGKLFFKLEYKLNRSVRAWHRASLRFYAANPRRLFAYPHLDTIIDSNLPFFRRLDLDAMVQYFAVMPDIDISPLLPRITVPTLVLTGDSDPIVPPAQSHRIAEKVPHADLVVLKGAGHFPSVESPAEYQQVVSEWLHRQLN